MYFIQCEHTTKLIILYFKGHLSKFHTMQTFNFNRRHFLKGATASLVLSSFGAHAVDFLDPSKVYRVGLIGAGWYGKSDLFRLIQVSPINVVALCDVDKQMLEGAADM